ncbi:MAG: dinitrogenase iron-molybdenum cofactor biosynthesis protein [Proteobacteria bacterium]|nr:dinitrogenase iron-molybdenum cofactor biosynthesis protein [Pseudomonadota bacterium]
MSKQVAISVKSVDGLNSILDPRFGRAFAYVVVDIDTNAVVTQLDNTLRQAAHGAGTGAAAMMAKNNVSAVISGRFGPKAFQALDSLGIEMWTAPDGLSVKEAVSRFVSGSLSRESSPSGGSGMSQGGGGGMGQRGGSGMGQRGSNGMGQRGGSGMGQRGGSGMGQCGGGMGGGRGMGRGGGRRKGGG